MESKILPWTLGLYSIAVLSTMAGMEIFGWTSAAIVLGLLAYFKFENRPFENVWFKADWALVVLFVIVVLGAFITAPEPPLGWGAVTIIGAARFVFLYFLLRLALLWTWSDRVVPRMIYFLIGLAALIGLYAVFESYTGIDLIRKTNATVTAWGTRADGSTYYRAAGLFDHPLRYCYSVGMCLCFPFAYLLLGTGSKRKWDRLWMALALLAMSAGLLASLARGAWIAVAVAIVIMSFYSGWKRALSTIVLGVVAVGVVLVARPEIGQRLTTIMDSSNESNSSRIRIWKANIEMFKDHPIIGVGYGQNEALNGVYFKRMGIPDDAFKGHAHNNYLQFLSGTGITGFACYMVFILFYLYLSHSTFMLLPKEDVWSRATVLALLGAQLVLHIGGFTECNFKSAQLTHTFMMCCALLSVIAVRARRLAPRQIQQPI
jgi:O-antigen ligase